MKKFIFYDTETTGLKELNYVQVIQIGSLLTDENFNDLDSFDLICAPLPWTLVTPKALLVNKKAEIFDHPQTHYQLIKSCLLYTSPSPRDRQKSRMPSSA